jgi:hypothetical protein
MARAGVRVMTGPQDPAAAGGDRLRAGHADRERAIEALKDAFVQGRLTRDELGARAARALTAQTYGDLAALTADMPAAPAAPAAARTARTARPPDPARRRPLVRAATGSGISLVVAAAAMRAAVQLDPSPRDTRPGPHLAGLCFLVAIYAVITALSFLGYGVRSLGQARPGRPRAETGRGPPG